MLRSDTGHENNSEPGGDPEDRGNGFQIIGEKLDERIFHLMMGQFSNILQKMEQKKIGRNIHKTQNCETR